MSSYLSLSDQSLVAFDALLARTSRVENTAIYALVLLSLFGAFITFGSQKSPSLKVPILGSDIGDVRKRREQYSFNPRAFLTEGYKKFKDQVFGVECASGAIKLILPPKFLDELKSHKSLSFQSSIDHDFLIEYTHLGGTSLAGVDTIKTGLNTNLEAWTPILESIVNTEVANHFSTPKDWEAVKPFETILHLIGIVSARVFHGPSAGLSDRWNQITCGYVKSAVDYATALKSWHPWLRPLVFSFLPEFRAVQTQWKEGKKIVQNSMRLYEKQRESGSPADFPPSALQYMTEGKYSRLAGDLDLQLLSQMTLAVAGMHTTSSSITHIIYDLASHPEYLVDLRAEVNEVLEENNGAFTKKSLGELKKMDSFMKESQRMNSPDLTTMHRRAIKPLTLSNGLAIPAGTEMEMATCSIHRDDSIFPDGDMFDGYRFFKMRQASEETMRLHQYVSVSSNMLGWGYGRHSCPGRYLADVEIKLVLAQILLQYDIKLPEGQGRPENFELESIVFPNPEGEILMKSRKM